MARMGYQAGAYRAVQGDARMPGRVVTDWWRIHGMRATAAVGRGAASDGRG